jgi:hypothetical protein
MAQKHSLGAQISEVRREIGERERVYARLVNKGTLRQSVADYQIDLMRSVLATLEWLAANEGKVKATVGRGAGGDE